MNREILKKLVNIAAKQQKILEKIAVNTTYLDPKSKLKDDLDEGVKTLTQETPNEMGEMEEMSEEKEPYINDDEEFSEENKFKYLRNKGIKLLEEAQKLGDTLPDTFDNVLQHMSNRKSSWDYRQTLHQLKGLSAGDDVLWGELGEYYPGWSPQHFRILLEKLK